MSALMLDDGANPEDPPVNSPSTGAAPVEHVSPLGYNVTLWSATTLTISHMIGAGIFSTPGTIFKSVGSTGLFLCFWILGPLFAYSGLGVYSELGSQFPNRSGGDVVYLVGKNCYLDALSLTGSWMKRNSPILVHLFWYR